MRNLTKRRALRRDISAARRLCLRTFLLFSLTVPPLSLEGAKTLAECIRASLEENPGIEAASYRVEAAREIIKQVETAYYPQVTASSTYSRTDNPTQAFMMVLNQRNLDFNADFNNPEDTDNLRVSLGLRYPVYSGGKKGLNRKAARFGSSAAEANLAAIQNNLIHVVSKGYYTVLQAKAFTEVEEETVSSLEENLRVARERFAAGTTYQTDALNLEVKLAQAREDLIRSRNSVQLAVAALNTAIGKEFLKAEEFTQPLREAVPGMPADEPEAIDGRPELKAARLIEKVSENRWRKAQREYLPTVSGFVSMNWDSGLSAEFANSYFGGITAEWKVFDGFRKTHAVARAKADWNEAKARVRRIRNNLLLDLKRAYLSAGETRERLEVSGKSVQSAEEALRITKERYREGAADITELLTAQVGLTATRSRKVSAFYNYLTALSNIERAKGRLVQIFAQS